MLHAGGGGPKHGDTSLKSFPANLTPLLFLVSHWLELSHMIFHGYIETGRCSSNGVVAAPKIVSVLTRKHDCLERPFGISSTHLPQDEGSSHLGVVMW